LIGLRAIGRLELLQRLFGEVLIPPAVFSEIRSFLLPQWIKIRTLTEPVGMVPFEVSLGRGETEAIVLSIQLPADRLILDDAAARGEARRRGLFVVGTLGILLIAKQSGLVASMRREMDALREASFHISPRVYNTVAVAADES
jgi:predicted nucleic acid-binding protein